MMNQLEYVIEELERALRVWLQAQTDRNLMLVQPDVVEDALEWLKKLEKCNHDCKIDCLLDAYNRVVAERDALKKGSGEWISVKDRLPTEKENWITRDWCEVICCCDFGGEPRRIDVRTYKFGKGHFWHGPQVMDGVITHWMPLPEPPKEG